MSSEETPALLESPSLEEKPRPAWIKWLGAALGLGLFLAAFLIIHHELKAYGAREILHRLGEIPPNALFLSASLTILNYFVLTSYDGLALFHLGRKLSVWKIMLTSFIAYVFSYNVGLSVFGGTAIRYRIYEAFGLSAGEVATVAGINVITLWVGFFSLAGVMFLFEPLPISGHFVLPFHTVRPVGIFFLVLTVAYLIWSFWGPQSLRFGRFQLKRPSFGFTIAQIVISTVDWILAAGVLFLLMPVSAQSSFSDILAVFLLAQFAGLVSHVPGGLGVFEGVVFFFYSGTIPASILLATLFAYRLIYYFLPLVIATALLAGHEIYRRRHVLKKTVDFMDRWVWGFLPQVFSVATFLTGVILLVSGSLPSLHHRMAVIRYVIPLPVVEISHFLGSLAGVILLFVAWGLHRRLNAAYVLTMAALGGGVGFSLLKGFDFEEATILAGLFLALLPCRKHFYRKTSLINEPLTFGWLLAVAVVLAFTTWLGFFSYKHVEYASDLWWKFQFSADAPRFLRSMVGATSLAVLLGLARLFQPPRFSEFPKERTSIDQIRPALEVSQRTSTRLALLGDKRFFTNETSSCFLMFGVEGRSWVVFGDPIGPQDEWPDLLWRFREVCDRNNGWPVFYEVGHDTLYLYVDLGLALFKLGEEALVRLETFSLEGGAKKNLRNMNNRLDKEGYVFSVEPAASVPALIAELKEISDGWLKEKNAREKGFSLGYFDEAYLANFPVALVRKDGVTQAFANLWLAADHEEVSIDLMRYRPSAPDGIMDYLFIKLMLWAREQGFRRFNLGMSPLAGLQSHPLGPTWNKIGNLVFRYGENFYNFEGLRHYKDKFDPVWEPRYIAAPPGLPLPRVFTNVTSLIGRGPKGNPPK